MNTFPFREASLGGNAGWTERECRQGRRRLYFRLIRACSTITP
jgi:hypothetical protein